MTQIKGKQVQSLDGIHPGVVPIPGIGEENYSLHGDGLWKPTQSGTFVYNQMVPSALWTIDHNLGKFPSISVVDSGGSIVEVVYSYLNNNTVELQFSSGFSGKAYLN